MSDTDLSPMERAVRALADTGVAAPGVAILKRLRTSYLLTAGPVEQAGETFWRVGICDRTLDNGWPVETCHLRFPTEEEAHEAVHFLALVAGGSDA